MTLLRAKWLMDGAKTLSEAAKLLEDEAKRLRKLDAKGYTLEDEIADDYGEIISPKKPAKKKLAKSEGSS